MSTRNDNVVVTVTIDGKKSISELGKLESSASNLKAEMKVLKKGSEDWIAANKKLDSVNADIKKMRDEMGLAGMTISQLTRYQRDLNRELQNVTIGTAEYDKLKGKLDEVKGRLAQTKTSVAAVSNEAKAGGGFMTSFLGNGAAALAQQALSFIVDFGKASYEAYQETKAANAQVEASLKSTGGAAGLTKKEIDDLAESLQNKVKIDDDVIKQNAAVLLTFTNIKKGVFEEALPAITDLAAKMDGDMKGATIQVGKALNDPIKGISALTKVGVSFSEGQKKVIEDLVNTGKTAEAQKLILAELNKEFGGSAQAAADAQGPIAGFNIQMGELQEALGEKMQQSTDGFVQIGTNILEFFTNLVQESDPLIGVFKDLWGSIEEVWGAFTDLFSALMPFNTEADNTGVIMKVVATAFQVAVTPLRLFAAGLTYAYDLLGLLVKAGKETANFFGADFEIDPSQTLEAANKKLAVSIANVAQSYVKIWEDKDEKVVESGAKTADARIKQQEEVTAAQAKAAEEERKRVEKEAQDLIKQWQKLGEDVNKIKEDNYLSTLSKQDREIATTNAHYDKLLDDVMANEKRMLELKLISQDEYTARITEIEALRNAAVNKIITDGNNAKLLEQRRINGELDTLHMSAKDKDIASTNKYFDTLKTAAEANGLDTTRIEEARRIGLQGVDDKYNKIALDAEKAQAEKELAERKKLNDAKLGLLSSFATLSAATNELISSNGSKQNDFQILLTLAQIALNTAASIGNVVSGATAAAAAGGPAAPFLLAGYITTGLATVFSALAQAKKAVSGSKTPAPPTFSGGGGASAGAPASGSEKKPTKAFAKGGPTLPTVSGGGFIPSYQIASFGELGPEYVIPHWMMQQPQVANMVGILEAARTRGYAVGGMTAPASTTTIIQQSGADSSKDMALLIEAVNGLREDVREQKQALRAYVVYSDITDAGDTLSDIQKESQL